MDRRRTWQFWRWRVWALLVLALAILVCVKLRLRQQYTVFEKREAVRLAAKDQILARIVTLMGKPRGTVGQQLQAYGPRPFVDDGVAEVRWKNYIEHLLGTADFQTHQSHRHDALTFVDNENGWRFVLGFQDDLLKIYGFQPIDDRDPDFSLYIGFARTARNMKRWVGAGYVVVCLVTLHWWRRHRVCGEILLLLAVAFAMLSAMDTRLGTMVSADWPSALLWSILFAFGCLLIVLPNRVESVSPPLLCRHCGYNLTGNISGTCPECGAPTPLRFDDVAERLAAVESHQATEAADTTASPDLLV